MSNGACRIWLTCASAVLSLASSPTALAQNAALARAKAKVESLDYAAASRLLKQAAEAPGTGRVELLQILELQGVTAAALGHSDDAERTFRELLLLEPGFKLPKRWGPKIQTSFFAARAWLDDQQPMSLTVAAPQIAEGQVIALQIEVGHDPLELVKTVRVHLVGPAASTPLTETRQIHAPANVAIAISAVPMVRFWVETLGVHAEVIQELGSPSAPLVAQAEAAAPAEPVAAPLPKAADVPVPTIAPETNAQLVGSEPKLRPLAYTLAGFGLAALITGVVFGVLTSSTNQQLTSASTNAQGDIVGLTQVKAQSLASQASTDAAVADATLIAGSVLLAGGVGVFIWGSLDPSEAHPSGSVGVSARW